MLKKHIFKTSLVVLFLNSSLIADGIYTTLTHKSDIINKEAVKKLNNAITLKALEKKKEFGAQRVMVAVMDISDEQHAGDLIATYDSDVINEKYKGASIAAYAYETGALMMPFTYALALENNVTTEKELVNGFKGEYHIGTKVIRDEDKYDHIASEMIVPLSSNVCMADLSQKLDGNEMYQNLIDFRFTKPSAYFIEHENFGYIRKGLVQDNTIYKATVSYGYGVGANLYQLLQAYSVFNNDGVMIQPRAILNEKIYEEREPESWHEPKRAIDAATAQRMKNILIKTVKKGTGKHADIQGIEIGGKTGTAHMIKDGRYVNNYNSTFVGFANDKKHKYMIGVIFVNPMEPYHASETAAVLFKDVVGILLDQKYFYVK